MADSFLTPHTHLVNLSLKNGVFPIKWKEALIRPLLKKAGLNLMHNNYRPVSNLSFLSKVVEKAVLIQFNIHCDQNMLLPVYQSAYRKGHSCETAIVKLSMISYGTWKGED